MYDNTKAITSGWICPRCGRENGPEPFCPGCGLDGRTGNAPQSIQTEPSSAQRDREAKCEVKPKKASVLVNVGNREATVSLDGVTAKTNITKICFLDALADAPQSAADLSTAKDRSLLCWTEGTVQYIAGDGAVVGVSNSCVDLFASYGNVIAIQFNGNFDTSNVTNMSGMFFGCSSLKELDASCLDTSNVVNMSSMFEGCSILKELDLSCWNTSDVTNLCKMFSGCALLKKLNLPGWNTSNVADMRWMFMYCHSLEALDVSDWDTSQVTNMCYMFSDCRSLKALDVSGWDTSHMTDMDGMFRNCHALTTLDVSRWNTSNVEFITSAIK